MSYRRSTSAPAHTTATAFPIGDRVGATGALRQWASVCTKRSSVLARRRGLCSGSRLLLAPRAIIAVAVQVGPPLLSRAPPGFAGLGPPQAARRLRLSP